MKSCVPVFIFFVFISGCSTIENAPKGEMIWQGLHAIDVMQTLNGPANDDCYHEENSFTQKIIGEKPSNKRVVAWGIGMSVLHYSVSKQIEQHGRPWMLGAWQLVTTGQVALTINNNLKLGIKPIGENNHQRIEECRTIAPIYNPDAQPIM